MKSAHNIFPEILFWEEHDKVEYSYGSMALLPPRTLIFKSVKENGDCLFRDFISENLQVLKIKEVKKRCYNVSLANRKALDEFEDNDYMQYIKDFNEAYREIKMREDNECQS